MDHDFDVEAALRRLAELRARMKELLEWEALAQQERRPHAPPGFDPAATVEQTVHADLRATYGQFMHLACQVQEHLQQSISAIGPQTTQRWEKRLERLQHDVAKLGLALRF